MYGCGRRVTTVIVDLGCGLGTSCNWDKAAAHRDVALLRAAAVSESSTKKVDWPSRMASRAPIRTKTASTGVSCKLAAGTQAPA